MKARADALLADVDAMLSDRDREAVAKRVLDICMSFRSVEMLSLIIAMRSPNAGSANEEAHRLLHKLWTKAVGTPGYEKSEWRELERHVERMGKSK